MAFLFLARALQSFYTATTTEQEIKRNDPNNKSK